MQKVTHDTLPQAVARLEARIEDVFEFLKAKVMIKPEPPKYLNINQAVEYCNSTGYKISKSNMYKLTARGAIPFSKASGALIFERQEIDKFINNNFNFNLNEQKRL